MIDQQIAQHFVQYSESLSTGPPPTPQLFYEKQKNNPFLNSRISANHNKE